MWKYVILATMMAAATQQARPHRQTEPSEGKFWWQTELEKIVHEPQPLKGPPVGELRVAKEPNGVDSSAEIEDESPPGETAETENRESNINEVTIDPNVVAAILSNGPEGAAAVPSPHPGECICVPYYQCHNGQIITDGAGIIDIRLKPKKTNATKVDSTPGFKELVGGNCPGSIEVCCRSPTVEPVAELAPEPKPAVYESVCGVRNSDGLNVRITNFKDHEAQYGEFPWMVAVLKPTVSKTTGKLNDVYVCGGSLVHPQVVLTAAHCVVGKDPQDLKIRVGEWDTQSVYEFFPHQDRQVVDAVVHEEYYPAALFNDVALLFLDEPISLGPEAETICLPRPTDVFDGTRCFATGWGKDQFGAAGKYQHILKKIELPLVPRDVCQLSLRKTRLGVHFKLHESFVCAGGEPGKDTCKGDGGSPLVCPIAGTVPRRYVQVGIVAWGIGCGEQSLPGVYANVIGLSEWIQVHITDRMKLTRDFFMQQLPA